MSEPPLAGIRVLSMEQAVALPVATRHLADMGAEIIRVQSHTRGVPNLSEIDLTRNKRQLALDLNVDGAAEAFLRVAATCDVVAHNYTPRVVRKFGIDYESVRAIKPDIIYVSLTGFGTTGPWGERPLFGPGAEAVSGHNWLIGDPDGWPGRPGTIVYADTTCGLNTAFAVLAALEERERTGHGQHIDVSLYETSVAQLGPVLVEAQLGARPQRVGNADATFAIHGVFTCQGHDRHLALAVRYDQVTAMMEATGIEDLTLETVAAWAANTTAEDAAAALQAREIAASPVADASDVATEPHLWERGYFGLVERNSGGRSGTYPHVGPAWGGGPAVPMEQSRAVGADSAVILSEYGAYSKDEIARLFADGASGVAEPPEPARRTPPTQQLRVERGELTRLDPSHDGWRAAATPRGGGK